MLKPMKKEVEMTFHRPNLRSVQAPSAVVMIRPEYFTVNAETAEDNTFQQKGAPQAELHLAEKAHAEITEAAETLRALGVNVHLYNDTTRETPDSVFPNNWFSTHPGGHVAIYPMHAESRRKERRSDIIEMLKTSYRVQDIIDYSGLEADGLFLEGTGAMVLDHIDRVAYAVLSNRTDPIVLERFCAHFNYEPMVFEARDGRGVPVYHTNVLMCIGSRYALMGTDMIVDPVRKQEMLERLENSGREIVHLDNDQIAEFAGNALELQSKTGGLLLALSQRAFESLRADQIELIERSAQLVPMNMATIELAGGSVRCTMAGIHLNAR